MSSKGCRSRVAYAPTTAKKRSPRVRSTCILMPVPALAHRPGQYMSTVSTLAEIRVTWPQTKMDVGLSRQGLDASQ